MISHVTHSPEVAAALKAGGPVVALESTIITHGMPYPQNLETARSVERIVRAAGATPATIAVMGEKIHIGLADHALDELAQTRDAMKLSRADMAFALAAGRTGSTTVAATMIAARLSGIGVFATGGIGGVHRGAEASFDISADLTELARSPVMVVCAGAKAILDIPKTLEVLETHGVPVITYGQKNFPAFWSCDSGLPSPLSSDSLEEIAASFAIRRQLNLAGGTLVANPVPANSELSRDMLEPMIAQAICEAESSGVTAKKATPFLLSRLFELTKGQSLTTNIALVENNARVASELAKNLCNLPRM